MMRRHAVGAETTVRRPGRKAILALSGAISTLLALTPPAAIACETSDAGTLASDSADGRIRGGSPGIKAITDAGLFPSASDADPFVTEPIGCEMPRPGEICAEGMTRLDRRLLEAPLVSRRIRRTWAASRPDSLHRDRREAGFLVMLAPDDSIQPGPVRVGRDPHRVELALPSEKEQAEEGRLLATIHTHPLGGEVHVDLREWTSRYWLPCHSRRDLEGAGRTGTVSYVVTAVGLYRFDPAGDPDPVLILCGSAFQAFMRGGNLPEPREEARASSGGTARSPGF